MKNLIALLTLAVFTLFSSCKTTSSAPENKDSEGGVTKAVAVSLPLRDSRPMGPSNVIPKATAFKMSGNYADNVAVTLNSNGDLTYFPAPTDISSASAPVKLADGWYLNRQGIGKNSVFTKYTFAEYSALPNVPSVSELKAAIIPDARVTEVIQLPYSINEAQDNIPQINEFLKKISSK